MRKWETDTQASDKQQKTSEQQDDPNRKLYLFQESSPSHMRGLISFNAEMAFVITNLIGGLFGMQSILGQNIVGLIA